MQVCDVSEPPDLVVGVVKVHRLTESHFSFRLQVVQLDRSRELQDPAEEEEEERSEVRGQELQVCTDNIKESNLNRVSPLLPFELELHSDIVLLGKDVQFRIRQARN